MINLENIITQKTKLKRINHIIKLLSVLVKTFKSYIQKKSSTNNVEDF